MGIFSYVEASPSSFMHSSLDPSVSGIINNRQTPLLNPPPRTLTLHPIHRTPLLPLQPHRRRRTHNPTRLPLPPPTRARRPTNRTPRPLPKPHQTRIPLLAHPRTANPIIPPIILILAHPIPALTPTRPRVPAARRTGRRRAPDGALMQTSAARVFEIASSVLLLLL